jgi:hypothetical protein
MAALSTRFYALISLLVSAYLAQAHEHHDEVSEVESNLPIDTILWMHIFLQGTVWGVLFPIGMVLGITCVSNEFYQTHISSVPLS